MKKRLFFAALLFVLILVPATLVLSQPPAQDSPPDVCLSDENLLPNCSFDGGMQGWQSFTLDGSAHFGVLQGGGECHAPRCPAGHIVVEGHFVGGIFQQVPAQNGATYFANIVWLTFDSLSNDQGINAATGGIGRQVGIDPFGGTDPNSPNIIWGPENRRNDCKICDNQAVTAQAQADTITVFIKIDDRWKLRAGENGYQVPPSKDQFWLDDIGLKLVSAGEAPPPEAAPTEPPPPPTDTPPPPTDTPVPEAPTAAPESPAAADTPEPAAVEAETAAGDGVEEPTAEADAAEDDVIEETAAGEDAAEEPAAELAQAEAAEAQPVSPVETPAEEVRVIAPPPTLTPTMTPTATPTRENRAQPALIPTIPPVADDPSEPSLLSAGLLGVAGTTICAGGAVLFVLAVVAAGLVWLYRLGWGEVKDEASKKDAAYGEEIIVESWE